MHTRYVSPWLIMCGCGRDESYGDTMIVHNGADSEFIYIEPCFSSQCNVGRIASNSRK
jgi:hypothetical protein